MSEPSVTRLVHGREHSLGYVMLSVLCGESHVSSGETGSKRMFRLPRLSPVRSETDEVQDLLHDPSLSFSIVFMLQETHIRHRLLHGFLDHGNYLLPDVAEKQVILILSPPRLVVIQHPVVESERTVCKRRDFFVPVNHILKIWSVAFIVFLCLGPEPCGLGSVKDLRKLHVFLRRDVSLLSQTLVIELQLPSDVSFIHGAVCQIFRKRSFGHLYEFPDDPEHLLVLKDAHVLSS